MGGVVHADPRQAVGLRSGNFDDDFIFAGIRETTTKGSTGQATLRRIDQVVGMLLEKVAPPEKIVWKMDKGT